jgi:pimeloyl-ACP methyl ester carboxylesterase
MAVVITAALNQIMLCVEQYEFYPGDDAFVEVDGHLIATRCYGEERPGVPVVFFEHGLGGNSLDWAWVQPEVAKVTKTCSYDRAGYGRSMERGKGERTHATVAGETKQVLDALKITQAVFVGHSMAGGNLRALEAKHPELFLGAVFADMINPNATRDCDPNQVYSSPLYQFGIGIAETGLLRILNLIGFINGFAPINKLPEDKQAEYKHGLYRVGYFRTRVDEYLYWGKGCDATLNFSAEEAELDFPVTTVIPREGIYKDKWEFVGEVAALSANGTVIEISDEKCDHVSMLHDKDCAVITTNAVLAMVQELTV